MATVDIKYDFWIISISIIHPFRHQYDRVTEDIRNSHE